MAEIKNIVFDVGRVLVEWKPREVLRAHGLTEEENKLFHERIFDSGAWDKNDEGKLSDDEMVVLLRSQAGDLADAAEWFFNNVELAIEKYDYADAFISELKANGYNIYVLSNYARNTYEKTLSTGLSFLPLVDRAFFSYQYKMLKPNDDIYQTFLSEFELNASECLFLDDRPVNIEGAARNGMNGIVFEGVEDAKTKMREFGVRI